MRLPLETGPKFKSPNAGKGQLYDAVPLRTAVNRKVQSLGEQSL